MGTDVSGCGCEMPRGRQRQIDTGPKAPLCEAVSATNVKTRTGNKIANGKSKRKKKEAYPSLWWGMTIVDPHWLV